MTPKRLSKVIQALREQKGMSQRDLAEKADVTPGYIAQLEMGLRKNPSLGVLKRLARVLGVPLTDLLQQSGGHEEFWQAEDDLDFGPTSVNARRFATREEAEEEARAKGHRFVAWYRGGGGDMIRRAHPVRRK